MLAAISRICPFTVSGTAPTTETPTSLTEIINQKIDTKLPSSIGLDLKEAIKSFISDQGDILLALQTELSDPSGIHLECSLQNGLIQVTVCNSDKSKAFRYQFKERFSRIVACLSGPTTNNAWTMAGGQFSGSCQFSKIDPTTNKVTKFLLGDYHEARFHGSANWVTPALDVEQRSPFNPGLRYEEEVQDPTFILDIDPDNCENTFLNLVGQEIHSILPFQDLTPHIQRYLAAHKPPFNLLDSHFTCNYDAQTRTLSIKILSGNPSEVYKYEFKLNNATFSEVTGGIVKTNSSGAEFFNDEVLIEQKNSDGTVSVIKENSHSGSYIKETFSVSRAGVRSLKSRLAGRIREGIPVGKFRQETFSDYGTLQSLTFGSWSGTKFIGDDTIGKIEEFHFDQRSKHPIAKIEYTTTSDGSLAKFKKLYCSQYERVITQENASLILEGPLPVLQIPSLFEENSFVCKLTRPRKNSPARMIIGQIPEVSVSHDIQSLSDVIFKPENFVSVNESIFLGRTFILQP